MDVFLCWSGERSKLIAETFREWLPKIIQVITPFISTEDIRKGQRWLPEISSKLEKTKFGIICLTKDNLYSPWIHFESGAISKTKDTLVSTFLFDLKQSEVEEPLSMFQHTEYNKDDVFKLIKSINEEVKKTGGCYVSDNDLKETFDDYHWPRLDGKLKNIPIQPLESQQPIRSKEDILDEILNIVRSINTKIQPQRIEEGMGPHLQNILIAIASSPHEEREKLFKEIRDRYSRYGPFFDTGGLDQDKK